MTDLTEGWQPDLPIGQYLGIPAMSSSGLGEFRRSPAHYNWRRAHPVSETDAMRFGTAVHTAILEPDRFIHEYVLLGDCVGQKKNGDPCSFPAKVAHRGKGFCGRHNPRKGRRSEPSLTREAHARVKSIEAAVRAHPLADGLLKAHDGAEERTGVFRDGGTEVWCKFRPDRLLTASGVPMCVDLKTCQDAGPRFWRTIADRGYHTQAALYRRGLAKLGTHCEASVLVAVESEPPHGIGCFLLDEDDMAAAHHDITRLLERYRDCEAAGEWPGYPVELNQGRLPRWAFDE